MKDIRLYKSIWQGVKVTLGSCVFVTISVYFLLNEQENSGMWQAGLVFFGSCALMVIYITLDRHPHIIINEVGIFDRRPGEKTINWEIISDAYLRAISKQLFICPVPDFLERDKRRAISQQSR